MKRYFYYFISITSILLSLLFLFEAIEPLVLYQEHYSAEANFSQFIVYIFPNSLLLLGGVYIFLNLKKYIKISRILFFSIIFILLFNLMTIYIGLYCPPDVYNESIKRILDLNLWSSDFFQYLYHYYLADNCPIVPGELSG